ncbi:MAG: hypothetical protein N4A62_04880 [Marinisporobacter sp.]|jgi:phage gp16-like protein|nr:hypothetical protein [Marinisporobacter sp.]
MSKILEVTVYEPTQEKMDEYNARGAKALAKILFKNMKAENFEKMINALEKHNKDEIQKD